MAGAVDDLHDHRHLVDDGPGVLADDGPVRLQAHEALQDRRTLELVPAGLLDDPLVERLRAVAHEIRQVEAAQDLLGFDLHVVPRS